MQLTLTVTQAQGRVPVTVLGIAGDLDGSNYTELVRTGEELYAAGARDLLLDMRQLKYMSSAGILALRSIALLLRGEARPDLDSGWEAVHAAARDHSAGPQQHVRLLGLQPRVDKTLTTVGFRSYFDVYDDLAAAVAAFG